MLAIPNTTVTPVELWTQQGPAGDCGPEAAGAILLLQATFTDPSKALAFWDEATGLAQVLSEWPGFIRRFGFADGHHATLIALWRSLEEARAFATSPQHQRAMQRLDAERWQYTHFAGLWEMAAPRERMVFCESCDAVTSIAEAACSGCGNALVDPFKAAHTDAAV
jgi:heme-degrading monooxygenase HmoA